MTDAETSGKVLIIGDGADLAAQMIAKALPKEDIQVVAEEHSYLPRGNRALSMMALMEGMMPGLISNIKLPNVKFENIRHQGERERARRQKQKDRAEAKALRCERGRS